MFDCLQEQIIIFLNLYSTIEEAWLDHVKENKINIVNMKKVRVVEMKEDAILYIWLYRQFIVRMIPFITIELVDAGFNRFRVKESMSITTKLKKKLYDSRVNCGRVEIIKVLNDLLGARIIIDSDIEYDEIVAQLKKRFPFLLIKNSSKDGYFGVHIYTKAAKGSFQWEIQIWEKCDEVNNIESHEKYKREYLSDLKIMGEENDLRS